MCLLWNYKNSPIPLFCRYRGIFKRNFYSVLAACRFNYFTVTFTVFAYPFLAYTISENRQWFSLTSISFLLVSEQSRNNLTCEMA